MRPFDVPTVSADTVPDDAVLLDVREPDEWVAGHVEGAVHVPMNAVPAALDRLDRDDQIVVLCKVGSRSARVTAWLNQQGFRASNLDGGLIAWAGAGRPLVSESGGPPEVV
jgi:rhodanese-related sulfurtransferase